MITDYFDKALYINLKHRQDRKEQTEKEFAKHGLVVERVDGIKGNPGIATDVRAGQVGCALSHVKCIRMAKENGWKTLLMFEDDVEFKENVNALFDDYYSRVPNNWDMIYLGGNHYGYNLALKRFPLLEKVGKNVYRTRHTLTTHAYAIKHTVYDKVIDTLLKMDREVDMMLAGIQSQNYVYAFRPNIAWQRTDFSDINHQPCDYSFMKDLDYHE